MPKPAHLRITLSGMLGGGVEEWAWGLNTNLPGGSGGISVLTQLATDLSTDYGVHLRGLYGTATRLRRVRVAKIGPDGLTETQNDGAYIQGLVDTDIAGNGSAVAGNVPLQTALCVGLQTPRADATGKGRVFLPWPETATIEGDYRIAVARQTAIATAMKGFLNAVNGRLTPLNTVAPLHLAVVSSKGYTSQVTAVRVGRVPDTMRSRRGELVEGYVTQTLA